MVHKMNKRWTTEIQEDPETGDALLEFPPELLELAGWKEGDTLSWTNLGDGSWSLTKKKNKEELYEFTSDEFNRSAVIYKNDDVYGAVLYRDWLIVEDRPCPGKSLRYVEDLAINWIDKVGAFK